MRVEITSAAPGLPFTGFVTGLSGQSVEFDGTTPFAREFTNQDLERRCDAGDCQILVSGFARKEPTPPTITLCLSVLGRGRECSTSPGDALVIFLDD